MIRFCTNARKYWTVATGLMLPPTPVPTTPAMTGGDNWFAAADMEPVCKLQAPHSHAPVGADATAATATMGETGCSCGDRT
jgi:hypothetical protein